MKSNKNDKKKGLIDLQKTEIHQTNQKELTTISEIDPSELKGLVYSKPSEEERYGSIEHKILGVKAFQEFINQLSENSGATLFEELSAVGLYDPETFKFKLKNTKLNPGDIVALAGDFYALPDKPISQGINDKEKENRFEAAYQTLYQAAEKEVETLLKIIDEEKTAIKQALNEDKMPSEALNSKVAYIRDLKYGLHTNDRYFKIAKYNLDHFNQDAREAYRIGHEFAIKTAAQAAILEEPNRSQKLILAFTQELFACHFLTDLFAAGHIRVPRRELFEYASQNTILPGKIAIAGLLSKAMHDEDGSQGLQVVNKKRDKPWPAYGDNCYFSPENKINAEQAAKAMVASLMDITNAFYGNFIEREYLKYLPEPAPEGNHLPLLKVENNLIHVRNDSTKGKQPYNTYASPAAALCKLTFRRSKQENSGRKLKTAEKIAITNEIKQLENIEKEDASMNKCRIM